jgi:RNA polymerase sigma-70 factor (ECF subfamily)
MSTRTKLWPWSAAPASAVDFEALYREQLPRVYNFFRYRFGDNALAEDLTATTFEKAWQKRERYRRDLAAFSTWLFTIARRVAIDQYRRPQVEVELDQSQLLTTDESPEETFQQQADLRHLNLLLSRLAERERELVALKYGAGLTNRAIATLSGLSESNVGVILHRALQSLRAEWDDSHE